MNFLSLTFLFLSCVVIASDSSNPSSEKSEKATALDYDFSHIDSVKGVQKLAVNCTQAFIRTMTQFPVADVRGEECFRDARSIKNEVLLFARLSRSARKYLPLDSEAYKMMGKINDSSKELQAELVKSISNSKKKRDKNGLTSTIKDFGKYILFRVQAVEDILYAINLININKFSFKKLSNFTKFLIKVSVCLRAYKEEDNLAFKNKIQALSNRKDDIQSSKIDWENMEQLYSSYMQRMLKTLSGGTLASNGTSANILSTAFNSLVLL